MKDVRKQKQLNTQLNTMLADAEALKIDISNRQREYSQKLESITRIRAEIKKLDNTKTLKVSEHAILRYFERVKGFDLQEIEQDILCEKVVSLISKLGGSGTYPGEGFSVVMKNNTVVTIL